jgi:hypothetical protein
MALKLKPSKRALVRVRKLLRSRKVRLGLAGLCVLVCVGVGALVFMQRQKLTPEYALDRLNQAIATRNLEELAGLVDFVSLSQGFAAAIVETRIQPENLTATDLQLAVQRRLLVLFASAPAPEEEAQAAPRAKGPLDDPVFDILKKPTHVLPPTMMAQLIAKPFAITIEDEDVVALETTIEFPQLQLVEPLRLLMRNGPDGWMVTAVSNSRALAGAFAEKIRSRETAAKEAFAAENHRVIALMHTYYNVTECRPILFPPDSNDVVRLRLILSGKNGGDRELISSASRCTIMNQQGEAIGALRLENTRAVPSGDLFEHAWFYTFEQRYPEVERMLAGGELSCAVEPVLVSLGRGSVLYPRKLEDWPGVHFVD